MDYGLILRLFKSSVDSVKARIISLSLLFLIAIINMELQSYTYMTYMYLFPLFDVVGKRPHRSEQMFPSLVVLGSIFAQNTTFFSLVFQVCMWRFLSG